MGDSSIILEEFGGMMLLYALYAFIVCTVIQYMQLHRQLSELAFQSLLPGNLVLFLSSTLLFTILAACSWYEIRLFGSHVSFLWTGTLLAFGLAVLVGHIFQLHSGLILKSKWESLCWNALFLILPHILGAAFYTLLSGYKYGH